MSAIWHAVLRVVEVYAVVFVAALLTIGYLRASIAITRRAEARAMRQLIQDTPKEGQQ